MTFDEWMLTKDKSYVPTDDSMPLRLLRECWFSRDAEIATLRDQVKMLRECDTTSYKSMFEQAIRTLAAIDEELGIGDDGCGEPEQTLLAIAELKAEAERGRELAMTVMSDNVGKG